MDYYISYPWLFTAILGLSLILDDKTCIAQTSHQIFEHLTTDQGLSSDKAEAVLQDRQGFYWIATQNGLNRFDGSSFKVYRYDSKDSTSLTNNYCTALAEGLNGDIWVATYRGVSRFLKKKGCFQQIYLTHPSRNFEITNRIHALAVDNNGNVWIAGNGLWRYNTDNDSLVLYHHNPLDTSSISPYGLITQIVYDKINNGLWFSTLGQIDFYDASQKQFYHQFHNPLQWNVFKVADGAELTLDYKNRLWFRDKKTQLLSFFETDKNQVNTTGKKVNYGINRICSDELGRIWIFYYLARSEIYDPGTSRTNADFFVIHHRLSALSEQANSLFIDKQKNYWITSFNGVSIYNESKQYYKLHQLIVDDRGIEQATFRINVLAQTEPASIWLGTNLGLYKYNLHSGGYKPIAINARNKNITALCADGDKLWIGLEGHLLCMDAIKENIVKSIILNSDIFFIRIGVNEKLWAGSWWNGLYLIDLRSYDVKLFANNKMDSSSLRSNSLITGFVDRNDFWIGYNGGNGFSKYSPSTGSFVHYHPQEKELTSSSAGTITVITRDRSDHIWLGTHGNGIFHFDPLTNTYENYQQQQGLNSNYINSIIPDALGHLWISTADGMNYFNTDKQTIHQLDINLVFQDNDVEANGTYGTNGKIYFYCKNEFAEIDPLAYHPDTTFPQLVISSFKIFDQEATINDQEKIINLSHRENFFSFEYSTIKTNPLKEVKYAYTLEGFDKDWTMAGNQHRANYTNVPEGNYQFRVKATNDEGQWSDILLNIAVHIRPPFWRTWWFIVLCTLFVTGIIYSAYRYRIRQIRKIYDIKTKISQDLHDDVGASLSSIHIYSSVAEKAFRENPQKAVKIVQQIKQNSRQVMEDMSDIIWALNTEQHDGESLVGRIKNYGHDLLSQKNIDCIYKMDPLIEKKLSKTEARKNVLLIVKEALNNIAKYSEATLAEVAISMDSTYLDILVTDNGKGFDPNAITGGNGLNNMKVRADSLGGSLDIKSSLESGTSIHSRIPLAKISDR